MTRQSQDAFLFHQDEDEEAEAVAALLHDGEYDGIDESEIFITEHTKDSLQVDRRSKEEAMRIICNSTSRRSYRRNGTASSGGGFEILIDLTLNED